MTLEEKNRFLKTLTEGDFLALGNQQVAYVREVEFMGQMHYSVHSADGRALTLARDRDLALSAIDKSDLEAGTLH